MNNPLQLLALTLFTAITFSSTALSAGKLYKWVDDKGETHYGDKIPSENSQRGHTEINQQGITVKTTEGAKTEEQLAEEQIKQQAVADEKRHAHEQATRDKVLLSTYASEADIIQVRDRKLAMVNSEIALNISYSEKVKQHLAELAAEAAVLAHQGKSLPKRLQKDIRESEVQDETFTTFTKTKQNEQDTIKRQAEADLQRFRELKAAP